MAETRKRSEPKKKQEQEAAAPVCPVAVCPVGMLLTATGQARPEAVEHLINAGRELMLAVAAVLNARAGEGAEPVRLEKIDLD